MAQLDVRERRMETTIAYVGARLAGKATNLHHLKTDSARGRSTDLQISEDTLSLEWSPRRADRFDDCDVAVKLVAAKGAPSTARLDEVIGSADGVVVVVDASPSARAERARVLSLVRDALSKGSARKIPVVVQANKVDLADAKAVQELAGEVEWPIVPASAMRGEGVVEDKDARIAHHGTRDSGALLLPAGERYAAFADELFVLVREFANVVGESGDLGGFFDGDRGGTACVSGWRRADRQFALTVS